MLEIKTFSSKNHKFKWLIYWPSWVWKTVFGWTAEDVIFASSEDWLLSVAEKNIPFAKIETLENLQQLRDFLKEWKHPYKTLVIDSITDINERIKKSIEVETWKSMEKSMWGELTDKIKWILMDIKNIDMHILIIAQEKYEKDEDKIEKKVPSLNWKLSTDICYFMDIVWYISIDKEWKRNIETKGNNRNLAKDRTSKILNSTPLNLQSWIKAVEDSSSVDEKVLYTIMSDSEKILIEQTAKFNNYKDSLYSSNNEDELKENFLKINRTLINTSQHKELWNIKDELKEKFTKETK